jgi:hypothetical protein
MRVFSCLVLLALVIWGAVYVAQVESHVFGGLQSSACRQSAQPGGLAEVPVPPVPDAPIGSRAPAGAAEPQVELTDSAGEAELARRYEPILRIADADRFWPVAVPTMLEGAEGEPRTSLHKADGDSGDATLESLVPSGSSDDYLDYPAAFDDVQAEFCWVGHALHIPVSALARWRSKPWLLHPARSAQIYFLKRPYPNGAEDLQYWFFYPLNYLPVLAEASFPDDPIDATVFAADFHEGDFEHVTVRLRPDRQAEPGPDGSPPLSPTGVEMARHKSEQKTLGWHSAGLQRRGTHPVVYVGFGGHASYSECGRQVRPIDFLIHLVDWSLCGTATTFTLGPRTALVDLRHVSWPCWPGHFGEVPHPQIENLFVPGPPSPFFQAGNRAAVPCASQP